MKSKFTQTVMAAGLCIFFTACQKDFKSPDSSQDVHSTINNKLNEPVNQSTIFNSNGLGQDRQVVWTQVIKMDAIQANSTSESMGLAILTVTADMKLTYKILVQKVDDGDMLTNAHIHYGAPGVDGAPFIFLAAGIQNLGKNITIQLTEQQFDELVNGTQPIYINVHSHDYPGDSIRGQIR